MKEKYVAWDANEEHISLILAINEALSSQDAGQQAPLQYGISYLVSINGDTDDEKNEYCALLKRASRQKISIRDDVGKVPKSIKVKIDEEQLKVVEDMFRECFGLTRIQRPFFTRVVMTAFYIHIIDENKNLGVNVNPISDTNADETTSKDVDKKIAIILNTLLGDILQDENRVMNSNLKKDLLEVFEKNNLIKING